MLYNVTVQGNAAQVSITRDGKGGFTGVITHTKYGDGQITGTESGTTLTGTVNLDGHDADFNATESGTSISGTIKPSGFLGAILGSSSFTGTQAA